MKTKDINEKKNEIGEKDEDREMKEQGCLALPFPKLYLYLLVDQPTKEIFGQ